MKISVTSHHYYPHTGGTERVVKTLVDALSEIGHEVHVFSDIEDLQAMKSGEKIQYHGIKLRKIGKFRFPPLDYWKMLSKTGSDIYHIHGQRVWSSDYLYMNLNKIKGKKLFTAHGFYQLIYGGTLNSVYYQKFMPSFLSKFDHIVSLTEKEKNITADLVPDLAEKISVIPDPVDFQRITISGDIGATVSKYGLDVGKYFIHSGGLQKNKNVEFIIRAMKGLKQPLVLTGNTPDQSYVAYLKQLASEDKINLIFAGNVPDEDLYTLMAGSDAFLFSSKFESFGVAMVEAVYSGARVISADTGVARDLSIDGMLQIVDSPAQMRESIINYKRKTDLDSIREKLESNYSTETIMRRLIKLYEN